MVVLLWVTEVRGRTVSLMEAGTGRQRGGMVGMGMHRTAPSIHRAQGSMRIHSIHTRSMYLHVVTGRAIPSVGITGPAIEGMAFPPLGGHN
jgi:hypothetical protein